MALEQGGGGARRMLAARERRHYKKHSALRKLDGRYRAKRLETEHAELREAANV